LIDCDVEEPNAHLFLNPKVSDTSPVTLAIPKVDESRCKQCGLCAEVCQFNAIAKLKDSVLVFDELCHGCGGCWRFCPADAITPVERAIGVVEQGDSDGIRFVRGILNVGEALAPPVVRAARSASSAERLTLVDAPPGTACPAIASVRSVDFVVLVTEPTPFGLNDLRLAVEMVREMGLPHGIFINRADAGDDCVIQFCWEESIPLLGSLPDDRRIAEAYSRAEPVLDVTPDVRPRLRQALQAIEAALDRSLVA
jgi:MinD superfamily P-loop ATPase